MVINGFSINATSLENDTLSCGRWWEQTERYNPNMQKPAVMVDNDPIRSLSSQ